MMSQWRRWNSAMKGWRECSKLAHVTEKERALGLKQMSKGQRPVICNVRGRQQVLLTMAKAVQTIKNQRENSKSDNQDDPCHGTSAPGEIVCGKLLFGQPHLSGKHFQFFIIK